MAWIVTCAVALVVFIVFEWLTAPAVHPDSCYDPKVRNGRLECGGPCCKGPLPCEPVEKDEART